MTPLGCDRQSWPHSVAMHACLSAGAYAAMSVCNKRKKVEHILYEMICEHCSPKVMTLTVILPLAQGSKLIGTLYFKAKLIMYGKKR